MADTRVAVQIVSSGMPTYIATPDSPKWPSGSDLLSAIVSSVVIVTSVPRRETLFLTRAHQRVMDRALRRSVRIIA